MKSETKIQVVLFDLDGTLVDTEPAAARAVMEVFGAWGVVVGLDDARYVTGRKWETAFEYLFSKYAVPVTPEEGAKQVMARYHELLSGEIVAVPGSVACVQALAGEFRMAVVSGSTRAEILFALDAFGIRKHFEFVLGAEDYPRSKPAPDGYLKALQIMGMRPDQAIVFEDSAPGIESARAAGIRVVAIRSTNHFSHDTSKAHAHVQDLTGVDAGWVRDFESRCGATSA